MPVGVGVSVSLGPDSYTYIRDMWQYIRCNNPDETDLSWSDFYGFWDFNWCPGNSTIGGTNGTFDEQWNSSGWASFVPMYNQTSLPVFLAGYGCINSYSPQDRDFHDTEAIYDYSYLAGYFSGGFLTEWANTQVESRGYDYGLINLDSEGTIQLRKDYNAFSNLLAQFNLPALGAGYGTVTGASTPTCDPTLVSNPLNLSLSTTWNLPTPPPGVQNLILYGNNGTRGQLVDVTQTSATHKVRDADGNIMTGLTITPSPSSPRTTTGLIGSSATSIPSSTLRPAGILTGSSQKPTEGFKTGVSVGVGAPVSILALLALGYFLFWWRRSRAKGRDTGENNWSKPELEGRGSGPSKDMTRGNHNVPLQLSSQQFNAPEIGDQQPTCHEFDAGYRLVELRGHEFPELGTSRQQNNYNSPMFNC